MIGTFIYVDVDIIRLEKINIPLFASLDLVNIIRSLYYFPFEPLILVVFIINIKIIRLFNTCLNKQLKVPHLVRVTFGLILSIEFFLFIFKVQWYIIWSNNKCFFTCTRNIYQYSFITKCSIKNIHNCGLYRCCWY